MWWQIILIIAFLFLLYLLIFRYKAPWVPIFKEDLKRLDSLIKLETNKTFYELGCGNGRVIFYLAKKYPEVKFVGIEISLFLFLFCQLRKILGNYKNVKLKLNDYMLLDLNQADYIYVFSNTKPVNELAQKIVNEVNKSLIVISYCFEIKDWQRYLLIESKPDLKANTIFIYEYKK